jgi:hypothetical protein
MLQHYNNGHRRAISGAGLAQLRRRMSAAERACLAADIVDGRVVLQGLTVKAIAALVGVNQGYVDRALRLTPEQREQVRHGDRPLVSPRPCADFDALRAAGRRADRLGSDRRRDARRAVRKIGIDRALNAVIVAEDTEA